MKLKIKTKDFRLSPGEEVKRGKWPTTVKPVYESKKEYHKLSAAHVDELSTRQRLHCASNLCALLVIFQGMDAVGNDGVIRHVMSGINP